MRFVLVPGAGGDGWFWHRVVPLLAEHAPTVAVDLPAADPAAGLEEYADVVATAVGRGDRGDRGGPDDVVLVAQSMGSYAATLALDRPEVRDRVALLVLVNAMVPAPGESPQSWWVATGQGPAMRAAEAAAGRDPDAPFDPVEGFFHDVPEEVRAQADRRGEPQQADRPFEQPWPLAAWPAVPTAAVIGTDDRLFPVDFQRRVLAERIGVEPIELPGGHLVALSRPHALAAVLMDLAAPSVGRGAG